MLLRCDTRRLGADNWAQANWTQTTKQQRTGRYTNGRQYDKKFTLKCSI